MLTKVHIRIHYLTTEYEMKVYQQGEFKLRGKKREDVALEFWKWIKQESPTELELVKVFEKGKT